MNFEKLNSENFPIWKHRMKALLITKGVGDALTNKDSEQSEKALALMCLCVSNEYVDLTDSSVPEGRVGPRGTGKGRTEGDRGDD